MLNSNYTEITNYHNQMKQNMLKIGMRVIPIPIQN